MRVYIVHPSDKARRLETQRVSVYECKMEKIAEIESPKSNIAMYPHVMRHWGSRGIRLVISREERGFIEEWDLED